MNEPLFSLLAPEKGQHLCGGNPALYRRLISRFKDDQSISFLQAALIQKDLTNAFLHAHTLKGLCAQLALPALCESADMMCGILRTNEPSALSEAVNQLDALLDLHRQTLAAITCFLSSDS